MCPSPERVGEIEQQATAGEIRGKESLVRLHDCQERREKFLGKCLESIKAVADEIIIVDTGSNDGTVDIARKYTDKVFFHPWEDNFSKARNQALAYATGDWILIIDADEELVQEDIPNLMNALEDRGDRYHYGPGHKQIQAGKKARAFRIQNASSGTTASSTTKVVFITGRWA